MITQYKFDKIRKDLKRHIISLIHFEEQITQINYINKTFKNIIKANKLLKFIGENIFIILRNLKWDSKFIDEKKRSE